MSHTAVPFTAALAARVAAYLLRLNDEMGANAFPGGLTIATAGDMANAVSAIVSKNISASSALRSPDGGMQPLFAYQAGAGLSRDPNAVPDAANPADVAVLVIGTFNARTGGYGPFIRITLTEQETVVTALNGVAVSDRGQARLAPELAAALPRLPKQHVAMVAYTLNALELADGTPAATVRLQLAPLINFADPGNMVLAPQLMGPFAEVLKVVDAVVGSSRAAGFAALGAAGEVKCRTLATLSTKQDDLALMIIIKGKDGDGRLLTACGVQVRFGPEDPRVKPNVDGAGNFHVFIGVGYDGCAFSVESTIFTLHINPTSDTYRNDIDPDALARFATNAAGADPALHAAAVGSMVRLLKALAPLCATDTAADDVRKRVLRQLLTAQYS